MDNAIGTASQTGDHTTQLIYGQARTWPAQPAHPPPAKLVAAANAAQKPQDPLNVFANRSPPERVASQSGPATLPYKAPPGYPTKAPPTIEGNRLNNERLALAKATERRRLTAEVDRAKTCPPHKAAPVAAKSPTEVARRDDVRPLPPMRLNSRNQAM